MADDKKNNLGDILKKAFEPKKEDVKPVVGQASSKPVQAGSDTFTSAKVSAGVRSAQGMVDDLRVSKEKQAAVLKTKTHQDLINAAYKAAEELKISPFVILKEEWSNFTNTRGNKYTGPIIDDLKHLDEAQKNALKKALGL
jgi:hypothetical protein